MSSKKRTESGEAVGPTWGNVAVTVRYVSRQHHCFVKCVIEPRLLKDDVYQMQVRVEAWRKGFGGSEKRVATLFKSWPHRDHKTMPGMLYGLLLQLDKELESEEKARQEALPF